jgi:NADH:ubiquinone oxidoreductase subunit K
MVVISEPMEPMAGRVMAWWCIIVGSLENLVALFYLLQLYLEFM